MDEIKQSQIVDYIIEQYNAYFQRKLGSIPGVWKKSNKDHHCFIPSQNILFMINTLCKIHEHLHKSSPLKFLDCGCGIGNIMLMATAIGYLAYGIEYEKEICETAEKLILFKDTSPIIHGDIATFEHYADYDVIYYFEPINKYEKRKKFIKKLSDDTKVDSIVISYGGSDHFSKDDRFETLPGMSGVYRKIRK